MSSAGTFSSWSTPVDFTVTVLDSPLHFGNSDDSPSIPELAVLPTEKGHTYIYETEADAVSRVVSNSEAGTSDAWLSADEDSEAE